MLAMNDTVIDANDEINTLLHGKQKSLGVLLSTMQNIQGQLQNDKQFNELRRNDFIKMSNDLGTVRNQLELLSGMSVLNEHEQEQQWSNDANLKLSEMIKQENFTKISLQDLFQKFILTWTKIFLELFDPTTYKFITGNFWWENLIGNITQIFKIFTSEDRMIYVGIGMVIMSFFVYFIMISA